MPYRKLLTDATTSLHISGWSIDGSNVSLPGDAVWSVQKYTLRGGLQDGIDVIEVDNGRLSFAILPTRGMGIWKGRCGDVDLAWNSPVKDPVHPAFVDLNDRGGLGWLKGFNEWIVRCGLDNNGAPGEDVVIDNNGNEATVFLPLHGKIANTPARRVEVEIDTEGDGRITVRGEVDETMLFGPALRLNTTISTVPGSNALTIVDEVTNLGRRDAEMELLYHCNYGEPLLERDARFVAPFKRVAPRDPRAVEGIGTYDRFLAPKPGYVEQVYFYELAGRRGSRDTRVLLRNAKGDRGSSLRFSLNDLPCFSLWKNTAAREDGYVTGLEPATNYPNPRRFEREKGRVITLAGGETRSVTLTVDALESRREVREAEAEIASIQKSVKPKVLHSPASDLS